MHNQNNIISRVNVFTVPITHKSPPGHVHKFIGRSADASERVFLQFQARPQQKLNVSRFLMDADAVQTGRFQRRMRPLFLVDVSSKNNGCIHSQGQGRPSVNPSTST